MPHLKLLAGHLHTRYRFLHRPQRVIIFPPFPRPCRQPAPRRRHGLECGAEGAQQSPPNAGHLGQPDRVKGAAGPRRFPGPTATTRGCAARGRGRGRSRRPAPARRAPTPPARRRARAPPAGRARRPPAIAAAGRLRRALLWACPPRAAPPRRRCPGRRAPRPPRPAALSSASPSAATTAAATASAPRMLRNPNECARGCMYAASVATLSASGSCC